MCAPWHWGLAGRHCEQSSFLGQSWKQLSRVKSPWAGLVQEPQHGARLALPCGWL